jgi:hypothetical protein
MSWSHGSGPWEEWQEPWQWHETSQGSGGWSQGSWSRGGRCGATPVGGGRATPGRGGRATPGRGGRATPLPPGGQSTFVGPAGLPGQCISLVWPATIVHSFMPEGYKWSLEWLNEQAEQAGCVIKMRGRDRQDSATLARCRLLLTRVLVVVHNVCRVSVPVTTGQLLKACSSNPSMPAHRRSVCDGIRSI